MFGFINYSTHLCFPEGGNFEHKIDHLYNLSVKSIPQKHFYFNLMAVCVYQWGKITYTYTIML